MSLQDNQQKEPSRVLLISAEPSSNLYAERLMEEANRDSLSIDFWGVGNRRMEELGMTRLGKAEEMAVMGFQEVVKHYSFIKKVFNQVLDEVDKGGTKVALLLDYAEFNMKLAGELKKRNIKVLFYIAPQIWAWRRGRVKQVRANIEELLCIFPFEEKFYKDHNVNTEFVGHPLLDEIKDSYFSADSKFIKKQKMGYQASDQILGIMPGSRKSELALNFRCQIEAAKIVKEAHPQIQIVVLVAPVLDLDLVKSYFELGDPEIKLIQEEPFEMLQTIDFAIVASGTATLVTGLMRVPMVVMYKMKPFSAWLAKKLVSKSNPFFAMINLIFGKEVMPERFQEEASPAALAKLVEENWLDPDKYQENLNQLTQLPSLLGSKGATHRVLERLKVYL